MAPVADNPLGVGRKDAALILKFEQHGAGNRGKQPAGVMIGSIVIADGGMKAPRRQIEIVARGVVEFQPFQIDFGLIVEWDVLDEQFGERAELIGHPAGHKEIETNALRKGAVGPLLSAVGEQIVGKSAKLQAQSVRNRHARHTPGTGGGYSRSWSCILSGLLGIDPGHDCIRRRGAVWLG